MKILNLNEIERPTLNLCLRDDKKTVIFVDAPDVDQVNRLREMRNRMISDTEENKQNYLYDFTAELLNRNNEGITFTADNLRENTALAYTTSSPSSRAFIS